MVDIKRRGKVFRTEIDRPDLQMRDLRRTHGTIMLNAGANIEQVSATLYHSSIAITQRVYADVLTEQIQAGQKLFADVVRRKK